jgi:hypothetical protein
MIRGIPLLFLLGTPVSAQSYDREDCETIAMMLDNCTEADENHKCSPVPVGNIARRQMWLWRKHPS